MHYEIECVHLVFLHSNLPENMNCKEESFEDEKDCYVKLESMPVVEIEDEIQ